MSTKSYDPYLTLASIFYSVRPEDLTPQELSVCEMFDRLAERQPPRSSFAAEFTTAMFHDGGHGKPLTGEDSALVQGFLMAIHRGWVSKAGWVMKHGIWDHFKGGIYRSERVERCADTGEPRVSYLSMLFGTPHSRRASQWNEVVMWPDGQYRSRFVYRGSDLTVHSPPFKVPSPATAP